MHQEGINIVQWGRAFNKLKKCKLLRFCPFCALILSSNRILATHIQFFLVYFQELYQTCSSQIFLNQTELFQAVVARLFDTFSPPYYNCHSCRSSPVPEWTASTNSNFTNVISTSPSSKPLHRISANFWYRDWKLPIVCFWKMPSSCSRDAIFPFSNCYDKQLPLFVWLPAMLSFSLPKPDRGLISQSGSVSRTWKVPFGIPAFYYSYSLLYRSIHLLNRFLHPRSQLLGCAFACTFNMYIKYPKRWYIQGSHVSKLLKVLSQMSI